jgi:hypothetical protein
MRQILLSVYCALKRENESIMLLALIVGLVGVTTYFASNVSFEMLSLSNFYAKASSMTERSAYLAAGYAMLAAYKGTAFNVYYILNALVLFIYSVVMFRSDLFSRATAIIGLITALLMMIPTTAGRLGMVFGLASLIPWAIWLILISNKFKSVEKLA